MRTEDVRRLKPPTSLNGFFSQPKLNIKEDAAPSPVSDISEKTGGRRRRGEMRPCVFGKTKGEELTHEEAGLSTGHDGCEDAGALLRLSAASQETEDGGARSRADT